MVKSFHINYQSYIRVYYAPPLRDEVLELLEGEKPGLLQRKKLGDLILNRIKDFIETFINGMPG